MVFSCCGSFDFCFGLCSLCFFVWMLSNNRCLVSFLIVCAGLFVEFCGRVEVVNS